jgi:ornithine carbamoyltransferase
MRPSLNQSGLHAFASLTPHDVAALLAAARALQQAAQQGAVQPLLRGKKFGLLCEADATGNDDAALFCRAAAELGAHVAHIRPSLWQHSAEQELHDGARLLARLYDAVECQGMPAAAVQGLRVHADVPVYDGLASPRHPTAQLAELLDDVTSSIDRRRFVVQAVLLSSLS